MPGLIGGKYGSSYCSSVDHSTHGGNTSGQDLEVDLTINVRWKDDRLTLSPNITTKSLWPVLGKNEISQIWTPTLLFRNCKGCLPISWFEAEDLFVSRQSRTIVAQIRLLRRFTCDIDLRAHPMDIQFCQIQLYTYEDNTDSIQLQHVYPNQTVRMVGNLSLAEYQIDPVIKTSCVVKDAENDEFSCLELRFRFKHLVINHLMTSYAPTTFIVILSWISFWLPVDFAPARVALGLTSLLTLATRLDQAQKNLPPVAYAKAMDIWMFACIFLVSGSLCEFAIAHYRHQLSNNRIKTETFRIKIQPVDAKVNILNNNATEPKLICSDRNVKYRDSPYDRYSRFIFPLIFFLFNVVYWSYYLTYYN